MISRRKFCHYCVLIHKRLFLFNGCAMFGLIAHNKAGDAIEVRHLSEKCVKVEFIYSYSVG